MEKQKTIMLGKFKILTIGIVAILLIGVALGVARKQRSKFCGGFAGIACGENLTCRLDGDYPDAGGVCVPVENTEIFCSLGTGDYEYFLTHDGVRRKYLVHIPQKYDPFAKMPLVLAFHGGGGNAEMMADDSVYSWISKSDEKGFIVAFPNGASRLKTGKLATWNAGNCCGYARDGNSDDVGFVKKVLEDIENKFNIDKTKIFANGISNGGMFSHRLACEMPDTFAAIAAVAGTNNYDDCSPSSPISVMHIRAKNDLHVLFNGGCGPDCINIKEETEFVSVADTISGWVGKNQCDKNPQRVLSISGAYCDLYSGCKDGVQVKLCVTEDGGHSWPGAKSVPRERADTPSQAINATDLIWDFFSPK